MLIAGAKIARLGLPFRAKLGCSCRYITEQSPEFCREWASDPKLPEAVSTILFFDGERRTLARLGFLSAEARFDAAMGGCVLTRLPF